MSRWREMWQGQVWDRGIAKSSFRVLLWARYHGQAGRAEVRRSLGDAHVWAHIAACLSPAIAEQGAESTFVLMGHPQQLCSEHGGGPKVEEPECRDS